MGGRRADSLTEAIHFIEHLPIDRAADLLELCFSEQLAPKDLLAAQAKRLLPSLQLKDGLTWLDRLRETGCDPETYLESFLLDRRHPLAERIRAAVLLEASIGDGLLRGFILAMCQQLLPWQSAGIQGEIQSLSTRATPLAIRVSDAVIHDVLCSLPTRQANITDGVSLVMVASGPAERHLSWMHHLLSHLAQARKIEFLHIANDNDLGELASGYIQSQLGCACTSLSLRSTSDLAHVWNAGMRATSSPVVCVVTDEVRPEPGCLDALVDSLDRLSHVAMAAPVIVQPDGLCDEAGFCLFSGGHQVAYGAGLERSDPSLLSSRYSDALGLACGALRRAAFDDIGGFDERLGPEGELAAAADFGLRLGAKSWRSMVVATACAVRSIPKASPVRLPARLHGLVELSSEGRLSERHAGILRHHPSRPGDTEAWAWRPAGDLGNALRTLLPRGSSRRFLRALILDPAPGGCWLPRLASLLVDNGIAVDAYCFGLPASQAASHYGYLGVRVRTSGELEGIRPGVPVMGRSLTDLLVSGPEPYYDMVYVSAPALTAGTLDSITRLLPTCLLIVEHLPSAGSWLGHAISRHIGCGGKAIVVTASRLTRDLLPALQVPVVEVPQVLPPATASPSEAAATPPGRADRHGVCFPGRFAWRPFRSAAAWCYRELLPVLADHRGTTLTLVGPPGQFDFLGMTISPLRGLLADPSPSPPWLRASLVAVLPIEDDSAAGWSEAHMALASGTPLVVTPSVANHACLVDGQDALVASGAPETAEAILSLLEDASLWERLHENGLATVDQLGQVSPTRSPLADLLGALQL